MPYSTILWPSDGSQPALLALHKAVEMARTFGARILALQVVSPVPTPSQSGFASPGPSAVDVPLYEQQLVEEVKKALDKTVADTVPGEVAVETDVRLGEADEMIIQAVEETGIDMIVMATHGRTGFAHFFLGSVAERVIRASPVPVLVVPGPDEE